MADKSKEQRFNELKLSLLEEIFNGVKSKICFLNMKAKNMEYLLRDSFQHNPAPTDESPVTIIMSKKKYYELMSFMKEAMEKDLTGDDAPEYQKIDAQVLKTKEEIYDKM